MNEIDDLSMVKVGGLTVSTVADSDLDNVYKVYVRNSAGTDITQIVCGQQFLMVDGDKLAETVDAAIRCIKG